MRAILLLGVVIWLLTQDIRHRSRLPYTTATFLGRALGVRAISISYLDNLSRATYNYRCIIIYVCSIEHLYLLSQYIIIYTKIILGTNTVPDMMTV